MMNTRLRSYIVLAVVAVLLVKTSEATPLYSQRIYRESLQDQGLQQSLLDLQIYLQKGTGKPFTLLEYTGKVEGGIVIVLNRPGLLPAGLSEQLTKGSIEDFVMKADRDKLLLVANHPIGLSRAIYSYLDKLGFKWYLPGEAWEYVPSFSDITLSTIQYVTPSFAIRSFFGTGGIVPIKALDPNLLLNKKWNEWFRRNRFGGQFDLEGHYGESFNIKYKTELQQHPEYLAEVKGKRQWSPSAQWCISNKGFRDLFIADRTEALKAALKQSKYSNEVVTVSVDPADGYGDCECDTCKKLGTVSDRDFFLANEVAKAFQKVSSRGYANLYAYNTHAAPPSFQLTPHLLVQIIPYAFQSVGTPEQMIAQWRKKSNHLFIYDYYGIPDWHWDTPLAGGWGLEAWSKRLNYWKEQGIQGYKIETSYSLASTGLGLYLSGRLGWNSKEKADQILQTFYRNFFGTSVAYMQAYFQKISGDFSGAADLPYLIDLLYKAGKSTTDSRVQERITVFKAYVHYLTLYYRWQQDPHNEQHLNSVLQYVFQIYSTGAIHSTRLAQLISTSIPANSALLEKWKMEEPAGTGVAGTKQLNGKEIEALFLRDRDNYPLLEGFDYGPLPNRMDYTLADKNVKGPEDKEGLMILAMPVTYVQPSSDGYITFSLKVNEASENNERQRITIKLADTTTKKEVLSQEVDIDRNWKIIRLKAVTGRTYQLGIRNPNWIRFAVPANQWLAFKNIPTYSVLGKLWFYVGDEEKYIYYKNDEKTQPVFMDPSGKRVTPQKVNDQNLYRVEAAPSTTGKWWSIAATEYKNLQFFKKPGLFFMNNNYSVRVYKD